MQGIKNYSISYLKIFFSGFQFRNQVRFPTAIERKSMETAPPPPHIKGCLEILTLEKEGELSLKKKNIGKLNYS